MRYVPCIALVWGKHIQCVAWQMKMLKFLIFILQHHPRETSDSSRSVVQCLILFSGKSWPAMGVSPWPPCVQPLMHGSLRNDQSPFWTLNAAWYSICIHVLSSAVTAREHPSQKHIFNQDMLIMITYIRKLHRTWRKTLKKNESKQIIHMMCMQRSRTAAHELVLVAVSPWHSRTDAWEGPKALTWQYADPGGDLQEVNLVIILLLLLFLLGETGFPTDYPILRRKG